MSTGSTSGDRAPARAVAAVIHAAVVAAAQHLVTDVLRLVDVADDDLGTLHDHPAAYRAGVVGGAGAAPAQGLDLEDLDAVGQFDEPLGARKEFGAEVGGDAEGEDVDVQVVDHARELVDLLRREELRLVGDDVVRPAAPREMLDEVRVHVLVVLDLHRVRDQAEP